MNVYTKLKHPLSLIIFLILGFGLGITTSNVLANKKIDYLTNAIETERVTSLGSLYEIMAWESYHLNKNRLDAKKYACRFTETFNPSHSSNPSTKENVDKLINYSKELKDFIGNEPQCYSFEDLKTQEFDHSKNQEGING
jgi:hypothetical protein